MLIPGSAIQSSTIEELDPVVSALSELPGSIKEIETPTGPGGAMRTRKVTQEQEIEYLKTIGLGGRGLTKLEYLYNPPAGQTAPPYTYTLIQADQNKYYRLDLVDDTTVVLPPVAKADLPAEIAFLLVDAAGGDHTVTFQGTDALSTPYGPITAKGRETILFKGVANDATVSWVKVNGGGGSGLPTGVVLRDPYAIGDNTAVTAAVLDASNTWADGDLTAFGSTALRNAGAPEADPAGQDPSILVGTADVAHGDMFDMKNANGSAYRFFYGRRNDGTSGWTRTIKG